MLLIAYLLLLIALLGHGVLWVGLVNRTHALAIPRPLLKCLDVPSMVILMGTPLWVLSQCVLNPSAPVQWMEAARSDRWFAAALVFCMLAALFAVAVWIRRKTQARPALFVSNHSSSADMLDYLERKPIGDLFTKCLDLVPGHQMFALQVNDKSLKLDRLDDPLDGLSIAHLSDLHFSGRITRPYFEVVMDRANELDADLVAITGDIIDKARCLDWLPAVLGRLESRHGVFYVLGNHDKRLPDTDDLRRRLTDLGLIDLGGRHQIIAVRGTEILVAGNERPWFGPRPQVPARTSGDKVDMRFRLLLAHTPDQIAWARRHEFDLMLAGHTHGGQIRLPGVGPIFAPSLHGIKYASGLFHEPPTVLHVSRGISGLDPLRWNCPPELAKLVLKSG
ncbi:MAG: metallophosphoesterase [Pirellulaceae bacterium]